MDVANPGAALSPFSRGKGISPWFEMSILTPASSVKAPKYSCCSMLSSRLSPGETERVKQITCVSTRGYDYLRRTHMTYVSVVVFSLWLFLSVSEVFNFLGETIIWTQPRIFSTKKKAYGTARTITMWGSRLVRLQDGCCFPWLVDSGVEKVAIAVCIMPVLSPKHAWQISTGRKRKERYINWVCDQKF